MVEFERIKWLGPVFVVFEAIMHVYLTIYLVLINASLPAIGFTIFELIMFIYLLIERKILPKKEKNDDR